MSESPHPSTSLRKHPALVLSVIVLLCLVSFVVYLSIGSATLSPGIVVNGLLHPYSAPPDVQVILWQLRLPVACMAILAGAGLAIAGSLMQLALDNPLAEPFTLGLSSAAGFGAALAIVMAPVLSHVLGVLSLGMMTYVSAFIWSLIVVLFIGIISQYRKMNAEMIALVGIAVHFTFSSLLAFIQYAASADQLQNLIFWMLGSLQRSNWTQVGINAAILVVLLPLLLCRAWLLTCLASFGEFAATIGVNVARTRLVILLAAAMLAGSVTATIGVIGFVGLVAPHIARMMVGDDQRYCLCASAACGILIMLIAAIASQVLIPGAILPIGMLTALLGVPFFMWQILRKRNGVA